MGGANSDSESIVTNTEDELAIISSIHTLNRNKKKCVRLELYNLVK